MNVLGIETSCDETSASVVRDGKIVLSNIVLSQIELHAPYGGVVPEIASRSHVESLPSVIERAVKDSGLQWADIDAVAATYGPGLASSLMVGLSAGKALAIRLNKPMCAINHIEAHIYSAFLGEKSPSWSDVCPFVALIVSGGHTSLFRVEKLGRYRLLGQTIDDAAGEAFDKGANLLGLGYPGGPAIDRISRDAAKDHVKFPKGRIKDNCPYLEGLDPKSCFSFSGLKTALLYYLKDNPVEPGGNDCALVAASYQESIINVLVDKTFKVMGSEKTLVVGGGVSLNKRLREKLTERARSEGRSLMLAVPAYCGDNAAMIAGLAGAGGGVWHEPGLLIDVSPNLELR